MAALVQTSELRSNAGGSVSGSIGTPTSGNMLVCAGTGYNGTGVYSVSDGTNTWTNDKIVIHTLFAGSNQYGFSSAPNVAGSATTVTYNAGSPSGGSTAFVAEWSGMATSSPIDVTGTANSGSGTTPSTNSLTTTNATDVVMAYTVDDSRGNPATVTTAGSGWLAAASELNGSSFWASQSAYKIISATGSQNESWTIDSSNWATIIVAYKQAGGGGGTTQYYPFMSLLGVGQLASAGTFSDPSFVIGTINGDSSSAVTASQWLRLWVAPFDCWIGGIQADARTAGVGSGNTVLDVLVNGTSIWTTAGNRPTLATASTGAFALSVPYARPVKRGDRVALQVISIPATTGHALVSFVVTLERAH